MNKKDDLFDDLLIISAQAQHDLYQKLGSRQRATQAHFEAARRQLDAAVAAAGRDDHHEALRLLAAMQKSLHEVNLPCEWAEFHIARAVCYRQLGDMKSVKAAWAKALKIEPDSSKLKGIAIKLGLIKGQG